MAKKAPNPKFAPQLVKLLVRANPYSVIDARGLLSGACRQAERVRPTDVMPLRKLIGAERVVDKYVPAGRNSPTRPHGSGLLSRSEAHYEFVAGSVEVHTDQELSQFYNNRFATGELIDATDEGLALAKLCVARMDAIKKFKAHTGKEPETRLWGEQYPDDAKVVVEGAAALAKQAAAAEALHSNAEKKSGQPQELALLKHRADAAKALADAANAVAAAMKKSASGPAMQSQK